ncbi:serine-type D-Ala-D-Ala carboxypeptidase [Vibrio breoganii]|uniref:serine-type D-Ala-D-Ala carboxypeptidase n=1 Tax=Vibrio breoganii TaxID=553239 RepID=UPI000C8562F1|nr:serine-type D-Ala-D-Ala carboxypeptidase [Vibrio breoganii]PML17112.1 serine-type D-Ala-D-Ala carboxypeptidase [Vibrio breoganii]PML30785.1 serine-type D-Ala-D-Ala carboxypeptidase [Vibrio breoganii]
MRTLTLLLTCVSTVAVASISTPYEVLPPGQLSSVIVTKNATVESSVNAEQLLPPASTLKLVTALAAKLHWKEGYQFSTQLLEQGEDYALRFSGDPSLSRQDLESLLKNLKGKTILGDLYLDGSIFSGYDRGVGWPWDVLGVCYAAPASALSLEGNCVQASIKTLDNGATSAYVPKHQPIKVITNVKAVSLEEKKNSYCDLNLTAAPNNNYTLSGCLVNRDKPLPLKFAVQSPSLFVKKTIAEILEQNNIKLNGKVKLGKAKYNATLVAEHKSDSLDEMLEFMLHKSNNLYADNITKQLGADFYGAQGSFNSGTSAIREILLKQTGIDLGNAVLEDGSGLSRNNRVSPEVMMQIMQYIKNNDEKVHLIALLPTSGLDGTLKYRPSMRNTPIKGNIKGKSGSLFGSHNMVGYSYDAQGNIKYTFVQFVSNYHPEPKVKGVEPAITQFEKAFYESLVTQ